MDEKEKFILITGASSGIGKSLAIKLSNEHNIILHGRDRERLEEAKLLCNKNTKQIIFCLDLVNLDKIEIAFGEFISNQGLEVIHFIHSAGHMKMLPLRSVTLESINNTFAVNVISAALITKTLIRRNLNSGALRSAIFISSNVSNFGAKAFSIYGSSKGALDSLMRSLAVELAPDVKVNSVLPGAIRTEMTAEVFENNAVADRMEKSYPLGFGTTDDIFGVVQFLVSEKSRWITGQQFIVDGGRSINISG